MYLAPAFQFQQKCAILHFFCSSALLTPDYYLNPTLFSFINHHKDLGVIFSHIATLAYKLLSLLSQSFSSSNSVATKKLLYTTLIRSTISYASSVWRPQLIKDIQLLEKIQQRVTKFILNDFSSNYKTREIKLNLLPLMMTL